MYFFQAGLFFSIESAKFWPILAHLDPFCLSCREFTHFLLYFLQALIVWRCTRIDKYQVCLLTYATLCNWRHWPQYNICSGWCTPHPPFFRNKSPLQTGCRSQIQPVSHYPGRPKSPFRKKAMNVFSSSDNLLCSNWTSVVFSWKLKVYVNYDIK